jgi:hypothetical protein
MSRSRSGSIARGRLLGLPSLPAQIELRSDSQGEPSEIQMPSEQWPFVLEGASDTVAAALLSRLVDIVTVPDLLTAVNAIAVAQRLRPHFAAGRA